MASMKLEKQYADLYTNYAQKRDTESLRQLMQALEPVITKGVHTFGSGIPTLYGRAKILAKQAIDTYDPKKSPLESHVMLNLQRLQRYAPNTGNVLYIPENVRLLNKQITEAEKELEDKFGRPPSDQEVADYLGLNIKKIRKVRTALGTVPEGTFDEGIAAESLDKEIPKEDSKVELWREAVYKELSPVEQYIAEKRLGMFGHKPLPVEEVAKRLKMSPASVSLYAKKVLEKLTPPDNL